jgi:hypothetical protein
MHAAGFFLMGLGVAAAIAVIAVSKQTRWIKEDVAILHPPEDEETLPF